MAAMRGIPRKPCRLVLLDLVSRNAKVFNTYGRTRKPQEAAVYHFAEGRIPTATEVELVRVLGQED